MEGLGDRWIRCGIGVGRRADADAQTAYRLGEAFDMGFGISHDASSSVAFQASPPESEKALTPLAWWMMTGTGAGAGTEDAAAVMAKERCETGPSSRNVGRGSRPQTARCETNRAYARGVGGEGAGWRAAAAAATGETIDNREQMVKGRLAPALLTLRWISIPLFVLQGCCRGRRELGGRDSMPGGPPPRPS